MGHSAGPDAGADIALAHGDATQSEDQPVDPVVVSVPVPAIVSSDGASAGTTHEGEEAASDASTEENLRSAEAIAFVLVNPIVFGICPHEGSESLNERIQTAFSPGNAEKSTEEILAIKQSGFNQARDLKAGNVGRIISIMGAGMDIMARYIHDSGFRCAMHACLKLHYDSLEAASKDLRYPVSMLSPTTTLISAVQKMEKETPGRLRTCHEKLDSNTRQFLVTADRYHELMRDDACVVRDGCPLQIPKCVADGDWKLNPLTLLIDGVEKLTPDIAKSIIEGLNLVPSMERVRFAKTMLQRVRTCALDAGSSTILSGMNFDRWTLATANEAFGERQVVEAKKYVRLNPIILGVCSYEGTTDTESVIDRAFRGNDKVIFAEEILAFKRAKFSQSVDLKVNNLAALTRKLNFIQPRQVRSYMDHAIRCAVGACIGPKRHRPLYDGKTRIERQLAIVSKDKCLYTISDSEKELLVTPAQYRLLVGPSPAATTTVLTE